LAAKSARLRQAKEEAEREIAEYRAQMEADFQRKVAEVCIFFPNYFVHRITGATKVLTYLLLFPE
jgi:hypothetical protein